MPTINETLSKIGFSTHESNIYVTLLENPGLTVYQLSKELSLSRSSIYPIVNKMYQEGYLVLKNGEKDHYYSTEPDALLIQLKDKFSNAIEAVQPLLQSINEKQRDNSYMNLTNKEAIIAKAKAMMTEAKTEIVMNTDIDIDVFKDVFEQLAKRSVRIIVFSFRKQNAIENVEIYSHNHTFKNENRIMLVTDSNQVLVASANQDHLQWIGTYTDNLFMTKIIYEHIHHDIYLYRIKAKLGIDLFEMHPEILIDTKNEKGDIFESRSDEE